MTDGITITDESTEGAKVLQLRIDGARRGALTYDKISGVQIQWDPVGPFGLHESKAWVSGLLKLILIGDTIKEGVLASNDSSVCVGTYMVEKGTMCLVAGVSDGRVIYIPFDIDAGFRVHGMPAEEFSRSGHTFLTTQPASVTAKLFVTYAKDLGATEGAVSYFENLAEIEPWEREAALAKYKERFGDPAKNAPEPQREKVKRRRTAKPRNLRLKNKN